MREGRDRREESFSPTPLPGVGKEKSAKNVCHTWSMVHVTQTKCTKRCKLIASKLHYLFISIFFGSFLRVIFRRNQLRKLCIWFPGHATSKR